MAKAWESIHNHFGPIGSKTSFRPTRAFVAARSELPMLSLPHLATAAAAACLLAACGPMPKPAASTEANPGAAAEDASDTAASAAADADPLPAINCGESQLAAVMNQPENEATRAAVAAAAGQRQVRWVHPGDAVTMDYQPGRLNVIVDEHGKIAATRCG
jgi:nitrous oxide reductase accessory protein NosL